MAANAAMIMSMRLSKDAHAQQAQPAHHIIEIKDLSFTPDMLEVHVGDQISWINRDIVPHTATADDESWDTGTLEKDQKKTLIVSENMTMTYFCVHHPSMTASIKII